MDSKGSKLAGKSNLVYDLMILVTCAITFPAAWWVGNNAATVAQGLLAVTILYLLVQTYLVPRKTANAARPFQAEFPRDLKHSIFTIVLASILTWAGMDIMALVFWILRMLAVVR